MGVAQRGLATRLPCQSPRSLPCREGAGQARTWRSPPSLNLAQWAEPRRRQCASPRRLSGVAVAGSIAASTAPTRARSVMGGPRMKIQLAAATKCISLSAAGSAWGGSAPLFMVGGATPFATSSLPPLPLCIGGGPDGSERCWPYQPRAQGTSPTRAQSGSAQQSPRWTIRSTTRLLTGRSGLRAGRVTLLGAALPSVLMPSSTVGPPSRCEAGRRLGTRRAARAQHLRVVERRRKETWGKPSSTRSTPPQTWGKPSST